MVELRRKLLPVSERVRMCAQSALDFSWMDQVETERGVFVTAEGLLMYLEPEQALGLIAECAKRFPGGQMMFDLPPPGLAALHRRGIRTSLRYRIPPMPFTLSVSEAANLVNTIPGIRAVHDLPFPAARGKFFNTLMWTAQRIPLLDPVRPVLTLLEFG
jgi:O-methyltransferase involved in polyketide biosynthesis